MRPVISAEPREHAWRSEEIALIGAIMTAAEQSRVAQDSSDEGTDKPPRRLHTGPPNLARRDRKQPLAKVVASLGGKLTAFLA